MTVAVGADGMIRIRPAMATHLVVDVQGYYTGPGAPMSSVGLFVPLNPYRLFDTRPYGPPTPARSYFGLTMSGGGRIFAPGTASGVVFNMTATGTAGIGHVTASPWPPPAPVAANLNFERRGQTIGNLVTVGVGPSDLVSFYTATSTHLIVDVAGYYTK